MVRSKRNEYEPDVVSPPGSTLLESLEGLGMTQMELAERTGRPLKTINEIIKGKAAITPETAIQLERVLGSPARFWNNRERHYRDFLARKDESERLSKDIKWLNTVPIDEMVRFNWITKHSDLVEQSREVLSFFGVATPDSYFKFWTGERVAFKRSTEIGGDPAAIAAWLRKGELMGREMDCGQYNERTFRAFLHQLVELSATNNLESIGTELRQRCAEHGVAVAFVPVINGNQATRLCGSARWLTPNKALIQLSLKLTNRSQFWFTFFHEAGHILLHGKKGFFVDNNTGQSTDKTEIEADDFARNLLYPGM